MSSQAELNNLRNRTDEKLANDEKYNELNKLSFSDIETTGTGLDSISAKADLTLAQIPAATTASLKTALMFRDDLFRDAVKFTYNTAPGTEENEVRTYIAIEYAAKVTGSRTSSLIEGTSNTENYDTLNEKHKSIFTDLIASASTQRPRRKNFVKTNAA